ncbi:MAG: hypothetical protein ACD_30C00040G0036 [uncultured bacterium]|uniref:Uncharacterized protein n=1 Tax=Candidatus Daviesbacteria bacterium GW2011_GWA1_36_8 TaxID=1618417 RepID=A0A0G0HRV6_9BACT|nr:MAG: hypothetical protein ACD_30C00040G0036 [uncultured bacterium]KKQ14759.1 MAG: hypothetical protein US28_C0030G0012 [Candidatus Daviesbacteria bacterium GW2011_GWA1_36_8]
MLGLDCYIDLILRLPIAPLPSAKAVLGDFLRLVQKGTGMS